MIKANFKTYHTYITDSLYQWDINRVLTVSGLNLSVAPEVHFANANMDKAIVRQATLDKLVVRVPIPNSLLQEALTIKAHIGIYEDGTFKVVEVIEIPVIAKARPADYKLESDEEIYSFEELKNHIANMVTLSAYNNNNANITARIDNIIAHNNDTEGNTELLDIRTDNNGKLFKSAGSSVRGQNKRISDVVSELLEINYLAQLNDNTKMEKGYIGRGDGEVHSHDSYYCTDFIRVFKGVRYVTTGVESHFSFYDLDKKKIEDGKGGLAETYDGIENFRAFSGNYFRPNFVSPCDGYIRLSSMESTLIIVALQSINDSTLVLTRDDEVNKPFIPYGKNANDKDIKNIRSIAESTESIVKNSLFRINLADRSKFVENKYWAYGDDYTSVTIGSNNLYFHTDYIPVVPGQKIFSTFRFLVAFDENKNAIHSESKGLPQTDYVYTVSENVAYIILTGYMDSIDTYMVSLGETKKDYVPYEKILLSEECIADYLPDIEKYNECVGAVTISLSHSGGNALKASADNLAVDTEITLDDFPKNLKKGIAITFYATFEDFVSVTIGKGLNSYRGDALKITSDNVIWIHYNDSNEAEEKVITAHDLSINTFIAVVYYVDNDSICHYTINTLSDTFSGSFNWVYEQNGVAFAVGGQAMSSVEFGAVATDISCPVWLFGDSYFGVSDTRVMGQLKNLGYADGCLICGLAGLGSSGGYANLENLIALGGMPKYLVWCEGMNDSVNSYSMYLDKIIALQKQYGFELILYKTPTVPARADINNGINSIVESSGYRYIDAKKAVGADDWGNWYANYLSEDGIHPSESGSKAIATRILIDVPEIMQF